MNGPLEGVRVLDVSTVLAAPVTATILGDFGAEVVKVEMPVHGDFTRRGAAVQGGRSPQWVQEARNKKSVTLNLREPEGQDILHKMVPHFDVLVTNFRPPTLAAWRLDPDTLQAVHPDGILAYITGYGLTGPYRDRGAFDRVASAYAGLTYASGEPDRPPVRTGFAVIDYMTAYVAVSSIMMALYHRDVRDGGGQVIDLALYESGFRAAEDALIRYSIDGTVRERAGNRNRRIAPANDFVTKDDRRVAVHAGTPSLLSKLTATMGQPELLDDPRFSTRDAVLENQDALYDIIGQWVRNLTADEVTQALADADVPCAPIMSIADIAHDPHYRERGSTVRVQDADYGDIMMPNVFPRMSKTPGSIRTLGPRLGEHTDEILSGLVGLSQEEQERLSVKGVI